MARVTVEDCILQVPNRFDLVMRAAQRARDISAGASLTVERDNDKNPVVALREIADQTINLESLGDAIILGLQKQSEQDEPEEDIVEYESPVISSEADQDTGSETLIATPDSEDAQAQSEPE